jgi:uncharacterized UBP type Zn finger protein
VWWFVQVFKGLTRTELKYRATNQYRSNKGQSPTEYFNISLIIPESSRNAVYTASSSSSSSSSHLSNTRHRTTRQRNDTPVDVYGLLANSVQPDVFDAEDNDLYVSKSTSYVQIPTVVFLHINRTHYTGKGVQKIVGHVSFPLDQLDIAQALQTEGSVSSSSSSASSSASSSSASSSSSSSASSSYKLYGFVVHHGRSMSQGHFTAYALVGEDWYHFNDHRVTKITNMEVIKSQHAYLLVYQKK